MTTTTMTMTNSAWDLTDDEREATLALKQACDSQGIHYESLFQLVKYVLVVHSSVQDSHPEAAEKRLKKALKRLQQRNAWAQETGVADVDAKAAYLELTKSHPEYFVHGYHQDNQGHILVGHHMAFPPTAYVRGDPEQKAKFLAAEQFRLELAASDLIEARRGIGMVTISDGKMTLKRAFNYLSLVATVHSNLSDMHQHRIKKVYSQVPSLVSHLVGPAKRLLPRKIAERITVCQSMKELHAQLGYDPSSNVSEMNKTGQEWLAERLAKYEETQAHLTLTSK